MEEKIIEKVDEKIKEIIDSGITTSNLENLYKLTKIKHMSKEDKNMNNYGAYGNVLHSNYGYSNYGDGYGEYGRDSYGRRGRDARYRGEEELGRISGEYNRYQESRNRYGAGEETDKSFHYMIKALEDFIKVLHEEADSPQQKQELRQVLQNSMR